MPGAYASLIVIVAAALAVGQAILSIAGRRQLSGLAGPVGLAALLVLAGAAIRLPGHAQAVAICIAVAVAASLAILVRRPPMRLREELPAALAAAALSVLVASIPFIASGRVGILGVGLVNDDMASHLLLADWLETRFRPEPVLVDQGYPLGPHSLAAAPAAAPGVDLVAAFAGLTLAIPALTAIAAHGALAGLHRGVRIVAAALVALPYLAAAYLAQEAFKEPIEALLLLGFALLLPSVRDPRTAVPLGVIAAGAVYAYSFPGLFWLAATVLLWCAWLWLRAGSPRRLGPALAAAGAAIAVLLLLTLPDWGRIVDFTDFRALSPERANEGGLGNLRGHLSPLEAFGIWPTSEFRLSAGAGSLPALAFYAGAALAALALALGLPEWVRRRGPAVPLALVAAAGAYLGARAFGTVYTSAKALAIASPLILLIALGGLLAARPARAPGAGRERLRAVLAAALIAGAFLSSFLVLRQAPVAPEDHMDELARIRPSVAGEKVLFLGRDNFVLYELRGSKPFTHVRNFYDPYFVKPNFDLRDVGSKFDFDALTANELERFPYVITTRAAYASGPPPDYRPVLQTPSYVLWRATDRSVDREPVERDAAPGRPLRCPPPRGVFRPGFLGGHGFSVESLLPLVAVWRRAPVLGEPSGWSATTVEDGAPATHQLELPPGRWEISLQYDATRPLRLTAPGLDAELPGNLDYRGVAPFWPAGRATVREGGPITVRAEVEQPPLAGRVLGGSSLAHLGAIAASPAGRGYVAGTSPPAPGDGARLTRQLDGCGDYGDWSSRPLAGAAPGP